MLIRWKNHTIHRKFGETLCGLVYRNRRPDEIIISDSELWNGDFTAQALMKYTIHLIGVIKRGGQITFN